MKFVKENYLLFLIIILAGALRIYGLNWDQTFHLHPDERMISIVASNMHLPTNTAESLNLFNDKSPLNPNFFAYGSFPIYLLKFTGYLTSFFIKYTDEYLYINLVGRVVSAFFDLGTLVFLYLLIKKIFNKQIGLISSFIYAIFVLPIQLSHFYAVDTILTFFITLSFYLCVQYYLTKKTGYIILVSISYGLALATKTSALLLIIPIITTLLLADKKNYPKIFYSLILGAIITLITFITFEPFALIDFSEFYKQTLEQQAMTKSAFTFPYTLQYVGKTPIIYEIKNIFFWGVGPFLSVFVLIGLILVHIGLFKRKHLILVPIILYFWIYFLTVSSFAIGFMRYLLPIYPLLALFAGYIIWEIYINAKYYLSKIMLNFFVLSFFLFSFIWPLSFMNIYNFPNTRVMANDWIFEKIPTGSKLLNEHWDDGIPLERAANYVIEQVPMYDPDTNMKWEIVDNQLQSSDYLIIASNRLYTPLQKLVNCSELPQGRCYTRSAKYYQDLFANKLDYKLVKEFSVLPKIPFTNFYIDDSLADESFTVYDHPKVIIFKNQNSKL